jgi:hypothetical protein
MIRKAGPLLIVLALPSTETLTLVDVTGTWEGPFRFGGSGAGFERTTRWVLQQTGAKVRGEARGLDGAPLASIEGLVVNGEVFR